MISPTKGLVVLMITADFVTALRTLVVSPTSTWHPSHIMCPRREKHGSPYKCKQATARGFCIMSEQPGVDTPRAENCGVAAIPTATTTETTTILKTGLDAKPDSPSHEHGLVLLLHSLRIPALFTAAATTFAGPCAAAVTGGRIGGGYAGARESRPSAPPMPQQQQPYRQPQSEYSPSQPGVGVDVYSRGSGVRVQFRGAGSGSRRARSLRRASYDPEAGDVVATKMTPGDVAMIGGVSAGIMALQRRNRKRYLDENGGDGGHNPNGRAVTSGTPTAARGSRETAVVTTIQMAIFCERKGGRNDVLGTLDAMSQTADATSPGGLSALVNEVCLTLLRAEKDWVGTTGGTKVYTPQGGSSRGGKRGSQNGTPQARAKRDFNRAVTRERSKWERETVSNTPERGFSSSRSPGWRGSTGTPAGTYAVVTLMIAWAWLGSTPPQAATRRGGGSWWWQDGNRDRDGDNEVFSVENRQSAEGFLEWLGDEAAEGGGKNILDLEVLWTPADADDSLDREDLYTKWPELRGV